MRSLKTAAWNMQKKMIRFLVRIIDFGEPELIRGQGKVLEIPGLLERLGMMKPLIITDAGIVKIGLMKGMLQGFAEKGIDYALFEGVKPDPSTIIAVEAAEKGLDEGCDCIIGFGGGSSLDAAKMAAVVMGNPEVNILKLEGIMKIRTKVLPVIAVPTTSGTGSECTIAAVITDPENGTKHGIASPKLLPAAAILDPLLTLGLPAGITAMTGMDALTHAVEAYISTIPTGYTDDYARRTVQLVFNNLENCVKDGSDVAGRENMMMASYYGGASFTRAMVGYVHAVAHGLGGRYHLPHGLANAIVLPGILEASLEGCAPRLAELADLIGLDTEGEVEKAKAFIEAIRVLNAKLDIPDKVKELKESDIPELSKRACDETVSLYAPPEWFSCDEMEDILMDILP